MFFFNFFYFFKSIVCSTCFIRLFIAKNFITIQQALKNNSPRQVRMCFLLHKYNSPMDYGDNTMSHAMSIEKIFVEFFHNVKVVFREGSITDVQRWDTAARQLQISIGAAQNAIDIALKDDFDTPSCIVALVELVKATNLYLESCDNEKCSIVSLVVRNSAKYVTHIFRIFGLIPESAGVEIGFPVGGSSGSDGNLEESLSPILNSLVDFRSSVREKARAKDVKGVLTDCDSFRDDVLPPLGIRLEDKADKSIWKLADPEELMKDREQRLMEKRRKEEEKKLAAEEKARKDAMNKLSPEDFMKQLSLEDSKTLKYSNFDVGGLPTHFHDNEPLNKSQLKKANKEFQGQRKKYEKYIKNSS